MRARPCGHRWDIGLAFAAHQYAEMGYAVLPLAPGAKKPHRMLGEQGGVHHATTSARLIADWWSADPEANVGVATGDISGLVVVDLDTKRDDGREKFWQLVSQYALQMSWEASARTPSGGWHVWLRMHAQMPVARERRGILGGVDVKGNGGYVVAAPSALMVSDAAGEYPVRYSWHGWACPCAAPLAPSWMADWIGKAPAAGAGGGGDLGPVPDLDDAEVSGFAPGTRNISFYMAACSMYARRMTDEAVIRRLRAIWDKTDQEGMSWWEVTRAAASAKSFIEKDRMDESTRTGMLAAWARRFGG
jgi:hypothetical protein